MKEIKKLLCIIGFNYIPPPPINLMREHYSYDNYNIYIMDVNIMSHMVLNRDKKIKKFFYNDELIEYLKIEFKHELRKYKIEILNNG